MKRLFFACTLCFALILFLVPGCRKEPVYPAGPVLTFQKFVQNPDSLQVVFSFTDGDGDIGEDATTVDPNLVMTLYHRDPATGQEVVYLTDPTHPGDSLVYSYRIPPLGKGSKGMKGEIWVTMDKRMLLLAEDTLQFNAYLLDQNHHQSAVVRTPDAVLIH